MNPVDLVLSKLPDAKPCGEGWTARCRAHDDKHPSLSVGTGDGGRALVYCHAGCDKEKIVKAIGLTMADLMPETTARPSRTKQLPSAKTSGPAFDTMELAVAALERSRGPRTAIWTYHSADDEPVGAVVRWNRTDGGKDVRPVSRQPDPSGGWAPTAMPDPRPLYRLPHLVRKPDLPVYVVEGEKCAEVVAALGLLATTSAGGSSAPGKSDWTPLAGRDVIILPDHDQAGAKYANAVARLLSSLTPAAKVKVVNLTDAWPDLPEGGDIADIVAGGEDPGSITAKLMRLIAEAEPQAPCQPASKAELPGPFPTDALSAPIRRFVTEVAAATGNDPACAALAALVTLAGTLGNRVAAQVKRGWLEPAILWGAIVAPSGTIKSPVLKLTTGPLVDNYRQTRRQYADELAAYEAERERLKAERDSRKRSQKPVHAESDPPADAQRPVEQRLLVSDVTCEKLGVLLQDNPLGLLLVRDELAAWIGAFDRYAAGGKGSDAPAWLSFFDASPVVIDRKTATGSIFVERASVSVLGSIQPGTLRRVFGAAERESGLLARLLLVQPPVRPVVWTDEELSDATASEWANLLQAMMQIAPEPDDQAKTRPRMVHLDEDAKHVYVGWHDAHGRELAGIQAEDMASHFAKLKGICIRLALLLACVDAVAADRSVVAIGRTQIERAIAITEWFKGEARRVYGALVEDDQDRDRRRLLELIGRRGGSVSCRELVQSSRQYKTVEDADAALQRLVDNGDGTWRTPAQIGPGAPKSRRFALASVYDVTVYKTGAAGSAGGNSVDVDALVEPYADGDAHHGHAATSAPCSTRDDLAKTVSPAG